MTDKNIIIIGPFCSGTYLIENILISNNFNKNIKVFKNGSIYWKHTLDINLLLKTIKPNTIILIMYRNIYNWIISISKCSYNLKFLKMNSKVNFIQSLSIIEKKFHKKNVYFNNIIDVYNTYYKKYFDLQFKQYDNVIIINYDKIINSNGFEYFNKKLEKHDLKILSKIKFDNSLNKPSKTHGSCVKNNIEALNNLKKNYENGKKMISQNKLETFIDHELIEFYENQ